MELNYVVIETRILLRDVCEWSFSVTTATYVSGKQGKQRSMKREKQSRKRGQGGNIKKEEVFYPEL